MPNDIGGKMNNIIFLILIGCLSLLYGCGGSSGSENSSSPPNNPSDLISSTLSDKNNTIRLNNVAEARFAETDAKNNPLITIQKIQDKNLVEPFEWAKKVLNIEKGSDYEVLISSSKPLVSAIDLELAVPLNLIQSLNDRNALAAYILVNIDDDVTTDFLPLSSIYNSDTQKLFVTLPNWALQADNDETPISVTVKLGLAQAIKDEPIEPLAAVARVILPNNGESTTETTSNPKLICPVNGVGCIETSRFGKRKPGNIGKAKEHFGIDFRANSTNSLIAPAEGTIIAINKFDGSVALRINNGASTIVYRHMSDIDETLKLESKVAAKKILGKAGNIGVGSEHLHLELVHNDALSVCEEKKFTNRTCTTKISAPVDPFPYFVNSIKIAKISPNSSTVSRDQIVNLELQGFDVEGNKITTEIDNHYNEYGAVDKKTGEPIIDPKTKKQKINIDPQGTLRYSIWGLEPQTPDYSIDPAVKLKSDSELGFVTESKEDSKKLNLANLTVKQESPVTPLTITAYWNGLENLKATYSIQGEETFWYGFATINECYVTGTDQDGEIVSPKNPTGGALVNPNTPYRFGCNMLSLNQNVGNGAVISFREGSEKLNVRIDQQFGCVGATSTIVKKSGSSFIFNLPGRSSPVFPSINHNFTITSVSDTKMSGVFTTTWSGPDFLVINENNKKITGTWEATKSSRPFPKCVLPTMRLDNTPPAFCPTFTGYGCDYRSLSMEPRKDEWLD